MLDAMNYTIRQNRKEKDREDFDALSEGRRNFIINGKSKKMAKGSARKRIHPGLEKGVYTISFDYELLEGSEGASHFLLYAGKSLGSVSAKKVVKKNVGLVRYLK